VSAGRGRGTAECRGVASANNDQDVARAQHQAGSLDRSMNGVV